MKNGCTLTIWIPDKSGIWMADLCPVVKWSSIQMMVWKPDWKKPAYGPKCPVFKWSAKSGDNHLNTGHPFCPVFKRIPYSDGYCISIKLVDKQRVVTWGDNRWDTELHQGSSVGSQDDTDPVKGICRVWAHNSEKGNLQKKHESLLDSFIWSNLNYATKLLKTNTIWFESFSKNVNSKHNLKF